MKTPEDDLTPEKDSFNAPDADWSRLDYHFIQQLAKMLDEAEIRDRRDS